MIPYSFNNLGVNLKKQSQEIQYETVEISFQVRTVDAKFVSISSGITCVINDKVIDLTYDTSTQTYSTTISYNKDNPVIYLKLTHNDYLPYSNTFTDYTKIPEQITMLSTSGSVVGWTATKALGDNDKNDLDTHVIIQNNNSNSSNYLKTHEIGYNGHILGKGGQAYIYGDGQGSEALSSLSAWIDRDARMKSEGNSETLTITPISKEYNYYCIMYSWTPSCFTWNDCQIQVVIPEDKSRGIKYQSAVITLPVQTEVKNYWEVYAIMSGELSVINNYTSENRFNMLSQGEHTNCEII